MNQVAIALVAGTAVMVAPAMVFAAETPADDPDALVLGIGFVPAEKLAELFRAEGIAVPTLKTGLGVLRVPLGSPARNAGIKKLDIIFSVNGKGIADREDVAEALKDVNPGATITVKLRRPTPRGDKLTWELKTIKVTPVSRREYDEALKNAPVVSITDAKLHRNVIHLPEAMLTVKNLADSDAVAFSVEIECFNRFDEKVPGIGGSSVFPGIAQATIEPGASRTLSWQLSLHSTAAKIVARVVRVKLKDGTDWKPEKGREPMAKAELPD